MLKIGCELSTKGNFNDEAMLAKAPRDFRLKTGLHT